MHPDKRESKAMTIAAGFRCSNGIVLCADQQISPIGSFKHNERKIFEETQDFWSLTFAYSGVPSLAKEAWEKTLKPARQLKTEADNERLQQILEETLTRMGRQYIEMDLQLLIAFTAGFDDYDLLKFDGRGLHHADNFNFLGVGDSSLIRFLSQSLYSPEIDTRTGANLAIYLVHKAESHIDHCGGPVNVVVLGNNRCKELSAKDVKAKIRLMDEREERFLPKIIRASSLPTLR